MEINVIIEKEVADFFLFSLVHSYDHYGIIIKKKKKIPQVVTDNGIERFKVTNFCRLFTFSYLQPDKLVENN